MRRRSAAPDPLRTLEIHSTGPWLAPSRHNLIGEDEQHWGRAHSLHPASIGLDQPDGRVRHGNAYAISLATGRPVTLLKILFIETFKFFNSLINIFRLLIRTAVPQRRKDH